MFQNNFGDTVFGIGFLIAAVYNGATSMGYLRKFGSYSRSLKIWEDPELEIADAKDYIKKFDKELKTHAPVVLRGVAIHREYDERVKLGLPNSEDFKQLDLYVKTTEISHGYIKDITVKVFVVTPSWNLRNFGHLCFWDDFYCPIHKVIKPVFKKNFYFIILTFFSNSLKMYVFNWNKLEYKQINFHQL